MSSALPGFVHCKRAQAAPTAVPGKPASAAVSGLVGALVGASLLGGERLVNGKKDPHTGNNPAARRRETLKRALLGGLVGGVGGAAYGHGRRPGGPLSGQQAEPSKPGNAIPAVPATVIGAILGAGALGGSRALTRSMDPAESEDLEEGSDSVWRRALLGAGLGAGAGYGLSWHTRPGGYLGSNTPTSAPLPDITATQPAGPKSPSEAELLAEIGRNKLGPDDPFTGALVGSAGAKLAPSAARVLGGVAEAARTEKVTPGSLFSFLQEQEDLGKKLPPSAAQALAAARAQHRRSGGQLVDAGELLRSLSRESKTLPDDLLADARVYRGADAPPMSFRSKWRTALSNIRRDVMPEKIPAGKVTQRAHAGRVIPALSGIVGALWGAANESATAGYQKQLNDIRSTQQ